MCIVRKIWLEISYCCATNVTSLGVTATVPGEEQEEKSEIPLEEGPGEGETTEDVYQEGAEQSKDSDVPNEAETAAELEATETDKDEETAEDTQAESAGTPDSTETPSNVRAETTDVEETQLGMQRWSFVKVIGIVVPLLIVKASEISRGDRSKATLLSLLYNSVI